MISTMTSEHVLVNVQLMREKLSSIGIDWGGQLRLAAPSCTNDHSDEDLLYLFSLPNFIIELI